MKRRQCAAFLASQQRLFVQIGADGDVAAAFLPLAGDVVVLRPFLRRAFRRLIGDLGHVAVVAGELDVIERHHLRRSHFVYFFDLSAVRQGDSVTSTFED